MKYTAGRALEERPTINAGPYLRYRVLPRGLLTVALCSLLACSHAPHTPTTQAPPTEPYALSQEAHPLLGKIWDTANQVFISESDLLNKLATATVLQLGETHDNVEHHRLQASLIKKSAGSAKTVAVAYEMISQHQLELLAKHSPVGNSDQLIALLEQEKNGWDYALYYKPVFAATLENGFKILAANLSRNQIAGLSNQGSEQLPDGVKVLLENTPLNESIKQDMTEEIKEAHCGMLVGQMAEVMISGQRSRDAVMATAIFDGLKTADRVILVAGSGHVRTDRGVPRFLKQLSAASVTTPVTTSVSTSLSIAFLEVSETALDIPGYLARWGEDQFPFDYVWFTPYAKRPDPCEAMKKHMLHKPPAKG